MIQVPYWDGNPNDPYPSVTALIDFRGNDIGDFVFHCHILNHEDLGMMNIIQVKPPMDANNNNGASGSVAVAKAAARRSAAAAAEVSPDALEIADRVVEPAGAGKIGPPAAGGHHH
jgi:hypothetical protein